MSGFPSIGAYYPDSQSAQTPSDVAVVMPTIFRNDIVDAIQSIYDQDYTGRISICIGIDRSDHCHTIYRSLIDARPGNVSMLFLQLPYSTSIRHGGLYPAADGGGLRTILSYMANSRYIAYLDDDNMYMKNHVRELRAVIEGRTWASGQRLVVDKATQIPVGVDRWDSVGPDKGRFKASGGFVDPNCLMIDKLKVGDRLGRWSTTSSRHLGMFADRHFFQSISQELYCMVMKPTVIYRVDDEHNIFRKFIELGLEFP